MSKAEIIAELPKLPETDLREIFDRIVELHGGEWLDTGELSEEELALIEKRIAEHEADPGSAVPWEQMRARLVERYGE